MDKITKYFIGNVKESNNDERTITAYVSTPSPDRVNESLDPLGAELKHFKQNPVVLHAHDYYGVPIGRALWVKKTPDGILSKMEFAKTELADEVFNMYKDGFMRAFSVGFRPLEIEEGKRNNDGSYKGPARTYKKWELLEYSAVAVPANPEALSLAIKKGILKDEGLKKMLEVAGKEDFSWEDLTDAGKEKLGFKVEPVSEETTPEDKDSEVITKPEVTEDYVRIPVRNGDLFVKDSIRTIDLSKKEGIKALVGKLKSDPDGSTHVMTVLFDKDKWTMEKAKKWIEDHKDSLKYFVEEDKGLSELLTEIESLKQDIEKLRSDIVELEYRSIKKDNLHKPKTLSEMADDDIKKTVEDVVVRVIRKAQGKVD